MKTNNVIIPLLVFVCVCLFTALELKEPSESTQKEISSNTKKLEIQHDSLMLKNKQLDKKYELLQLENDSLRQKISSTKQNINQLNNRKHENLIRIDSLHSHGLYNFFSNFSTADISSDK